MQAVSYAQRPAKHIQRRMVVDALRRLRVFSPLSAYEYVGFGGMEFVDFELIHRDLGIRAMTSIEVNGKHADRYRFNAPFSDVRFYFDRASAVLPDLLDSAVLRVVWLDYERGIGTEVLQDLRTAVRKLVPGSIILISVNAQGPPKASDRLREFQELVEPERVPADTTDASLGKWGWADACQRVLLGEAEGEAIDRSDGADFEQLFHFQYQDGARMLTWGGILVAASNRTALAGANFDELSQVVRKGAAPTVIAPPVLTMREALHLNAQLPGAKASELLANGISEGDLESYVELYRWYPPIPTAM